MPAAGRARPGHGGTSSTRAGVVRPAGKAWSGKEVRKPPAKYLLKDGTEAVINGEYQFIALISKCVFFYFLLLYVIDVVFIVFILFCCVVLLCAMCVCVFLHMSVCPLRVC